MDADSNHGCHERIMPFVCMAHTLQSVIIGAVVDTVPWRCVDYNLLISICARTVGSKADIPFGPGLDDSPYWNRCRSFLQFGTSDLFRRGSAHGVTAGLLTVKASWQFFLTIRAFIFVK